MIKENMRWGDILSNIYLIFLVYLSAAALEGTSWVSGLSHVTHLAVLGVLAGLTIGQSNFKKRTTVWLMLSYSVVLLFWELVFAGNREIEWLDKVYFMILRIQNALYQLLNNQPLQDGVLFFLGMGILYWLIGLFSGFCLNRYAKPWLPLGISAFVVIMIQLFQAVELRDNLLSAVFAFFFLMLLVRLNYWTSHLTWVEEQVSEDVDTSNTYGKVGFILAVLLVVIAWSTPLVVKIMTPGTDEQLSFSERFEGFSTAAENFFAPFKKITGNQQGYFGHTLSMGSERSLSEAPIFSAAVPSNNFYQGRYYWRATAYDNYQNGFWQETPANEKTILANQPFSQDDQEAQNIGVFSFLAIERLSTIFAFSDIQSIDRDVKVQYLDIGDSEQFLSASPIRTIRSGDTYQVTSSYRKLFRDDLISTREEIPQEILDRYLQVPKSIYEQLKLLALEVITEEITTYEKVLTVNTFLRKNYLYEDRLQGLSERDDPVVWFLFENKKGFCNYFASAEVLLLRTLGIPARLAAGYSQGRWVESGGYYEVREKDSHAWAEVYFPDIGWVAFEPTPSQPTIIYESKSLRSSTENGGILEGQNEELEDGAIGIPRAIEKEDLEVNVQDENHSILEMINLNRLWVVFVFSVFLIYIVLQKKSKSKQAFPTWLESNLSNRGIESPRWVSEWAKQQRLTPFDKLLNQISWILNILEGKYSQGETARQKIKQLGESLPEVKKEANEFLTEYEQEMYGQRQGNYKKSQGIIKNLWKATFRKYFENKWNQFKNRFLKSN